jgi:membrane protein
MNLPALTLIRQIVSYLRFVSRRFVEDRCLTVAGSLTYTTLLSLVPLFTVSIILTSQLPAIRSLIEQVRAFALKNLEPAVGGRMVTAYMEQFAENASKLTYIGLLIVVATAVALMFTIDGAFNDIWRTKRQRSWWKRLAVYIGVLVVGPLLIGASLSVTSYLIHLSRNLESSLPFLDDWLLNLAPFSLITTALFLAYRFIPSRHVPGRHALFGAILAGLTFEIVKHLFVIYIMRVPTYSMVYGTFAAVPIFLLWIFCCWMVVLLGAEVTATLSYFRHDKSVAPFTVQSAPFAQAVQILDALAVAEAGLEFAPLRLRAPMPIDVAEDLLHDLTDAKIIQIDSRKNYRLILARDQISDEEVIRALNRPTY